MRIQLKKDLNDTKIIQECKNIYYLHKTDTIKCDKYIEYEIISQKDNDYCNNRNLSTDYIIQVDVFSKYENGFKIMQVIKEVLEKKGYRFYNAYDTYEDDTNLYHFATRFAYKKIN